MRKLIVNADDFGLTSGCSKGILEAMKNGIVTSTTVMMNMEKAKPSIKLAKKKGIDSLGIHLTLTCGKPLSSPKEVPSLVDEKGNFYKRRHNLFPKMNLDEVKLELTRQIKAFLDTDMKLSHLDSHHHIHMYDELRELIANLAKDYNVALRQPNKETKALLDKLGVKTTDYFSMDFYGEKATLKDIKQILEVWKEGTLEIMAHPAYVDDDLLNISSYNENRKTELDVLTNKDLLNWLTKEEIELINFKDLGN
ncbi:MAG: chitin disaccharide deacetylase [Firmicutes bacterium]|nr:chitin disaccharide deacetylase [Bacillota bacterium]